MDVLNLYNQSTNFDVMNFQCSSISIVHIDEYSNEWSLSYLWTIIKSTSFHNMVFHDSYFIRDITFIQMMRFHHCDESRSVWRILITVLNFSWRYTFSSIYIINKLMIFVTNIVFIMEMNFQIMNIFLLWYKMMNFDNNDEILLKW